VGDQAAKALEVQDLLAAKGVRAEVVPVCRVKPAFVRDEAIAGSGSMAVVSGGRKATGGRFVVSLENGVVIGGFGESVGADLRFGWPDAPVGHGTVEELEREFGFDAESVAEAIRWRIGR
jgi:transketolase C-terminal domain/subunit